MRSRCGANAQVSLLRSATAAVASHLHSPAADVAMAVKVDYVRDASIGWCRQQFSERYGPELEMRCIVLIG